MKTHVVCSALNRHSQLPIKKNPIYYSHVKETLFSVKYEERASFSMNTKIATTRQTFLIAQNYEEIHPTKNKSPPPDVKGEVSTL